MTQTNLRHESLYAHHHDGPHDDVSIRDLADAGMDARNVGLVGDLLTASARSLSATQDTLWQNERRRRMALEMRIDEFLRAADHAYQGTVREYEKVVDLIRLPVKDDESYYRAHPEFEGDMN